MKQDKIKLIMTIACICFAVLAVVFLVSGIIYSGDHVFTKVILFVIAVISVVATGELAYLVWFSKGGETPNFFLFNESKKVNIPVEELSDKRINEKMMEYFSDFASSEGKLWTGNILENSEIESHFKPAVAYKLLYDLAVIDKEAGWKCFGLASVATVEFIALALEQNGDVDMAGYIRQFKQMHTLNIPQFREFIVSNKDYLGLRLCSYVRENIGRFE